MLYEVLYIVIVLLWKLAWNLALNASVEYICMCLFLGKFTDFPLASIACSNCLIKLLAMHLNQSTTSRSNHCKHVLHTDSRHIPTVAGWWPHLHIIAVYWHQHRPRALNIYHVWSFTLCPQFMLYHIIWYMPAAQIC